MPRRVRFSSCFKDTRTQVRFVSLLSLSPSRLKLTPISAHHHSQSSRSTSLNPPISSLQDQEISTLGFGPTRTCRLQSFSSLSLSFFLSRLSSSSSFLFLPRLARGFFLSFPFFYLFLFFFFFTWVLGIYILCHLFLEISVQGFRFTLLALRRRVRAFSHPSGEREIRPGQSSLS